MSVLLHGENERYRPTSRGPHHKKDPPSVYSAFQNPGVALSQIEGSVVPMALEALGSSVCCYPDISSFALFFF
jgi:hypothetical protein